MDILFIGMGITAMLTENAQLEYRARRNSELCCGALEALTRLEAETYLPKTEQVPLFIIKTKKHDFGKQKDHPVKKVLENATLRYF